jgi:hypothetical protein
MNAFFSAGLGDEATRRMPFVQQISSSVRGCITKVQTMPAEPILRPDPLAACARAGADGCPFGRPNGSAA